MSTKKYISFSVACFMILNIANTAHSASVTAPDSDTIKAYISPKHIRGQKQFFKAEQELIAGKEFQISGVAMFRGLNATGNFISGMTKSDASHIALILKDQDGLEYAFESTGSPKEIRRGILPQVRINLFDRVEKEYKGHIWGRDIIFNSDNAPDTASVTALVHKYLGLSYESNMFELLSSAAQTNKQKITSDSFFCSELVAQVLKDLNYLPENVICNNVLPAHFFDDRKHTHHPITLQDKEQDILPNLLQGVVLGQQDVLKLYIKPPRFTKAYSLFNHFNKALASIM